ncbi:MAG: flagellar basal body-associated protein FliL [Xanthobacteraceae bacterium]|nr:MAG: flagellar basal body-associated protein FliL [Xanthobacteraceae bacterium]
MADNDQMDDAEGGQAAAPPKSKVKFIIIAAAAVMVLVTTATGGYFVFLRKPAEHKPVEVVAKPPVFMDVPEVMVNLSQSLGERTQYLKVKVVLELKEQALADRIKPVLPRVMDTFQTYMRELRPMDLNGSAGLYRLREELTRRINVAIAPTQINAVLFKEIVIQ